MTLSQEENPLEPQTTQRHDERRSATARPRGWQVVRTILFGAAFTIAVVLGIIIPVVVSLFALKISLALAIACWIALSLLIVWALVAGVQALRLRRSPKRRPIATYRAPIVVAIATTAALGMLAGVTILAPVPGMSTASAPIEPKFWDLDTESRIGYWKFESTAPETLDTPIVYLHGGPGGHSLPSDFKLMPKLAETGHDTYMFDQAGGGFSSDLENDEYTQERSLADIEAIRTEIGAEKVILVGQSAGGYLAEAYAANYPQRVEKNILISPGVFDPSPEAAEVNNADLAAQAKVDPEQGDRNTANDDLKAVIGSSKRATASFVIREYLGPEAAANLLSQDDSRRLTATGLGIASGLNVAANLALVADFRANWTDTLEKVSTASIPTLLVRAQWDFIGWPGQREYRDANPDSVVVYIPNGEHTPWENAPTETYDALKNFITDEPQPVYTGDENPALATD